MEKDMEKDIEKKDTQLEAENKENKRLHSKQRHNINKSKQEISKIDSENDRWSVEEIRRSFIIGELLKPPLSIRKRGIRDVSCSNRRR